MFRTLHYPNLRTCLVSIEISCSIRWTDEPVALLIEFFGQPIYAPVMAGAWDRTLPQFVEAGVSFRLDPALVRYRAFGALVNPGTRTPVGIDFTHARHRTIGGACRNRQPDDLRGRGLEGVSAGAHSPAATRLRQLHVAVSGR